jgi:NAD(P)-dependent dehydrogenase (short-subunit alcohol dehydrogenase family)
MTTHAQTSTRIALVTGGNRGLGRSSVLALAAGGTDVVLTYRAGEEQAAAVVKEVTALGRIGVALRLDTTEPETFATFAGALRETVEATWGRDTIDVLVNNAGFARLTPLGGTEAATIAELVAVHFTGVVLLTQELAPLIADGGRIINTSTGLARFTGDFGYSVYASVKGAVEVYTRYLAKELGPRRIAVNTIAPGATGTDFGGGSLRDDAEMRAHLGAVTAMGHVGEPDDVGAAIAALAAPGMGWVTGQRVEASGGMNL